MLIKVTYTLVFEPEQKYVNKESLRGEVNLRALKGSESFLKGTSIFKLSVYCFNLLFENSNKFSQSDI